MNSFNLEGHIERRSYWFYPVRKTMPVTSSTAWQQAAVSLSDSVDSSCGTNRNLATKPHRQGFPGVQGKDHGGAGSRTEDERVSSAHMKHMAKSSTFHVTNVNASKLRHRGIGKKGGSVENQTLLSGGDESAENLIESTGDVYSSEYFSTKDGGKGKKICINENNNKLNFRGYHSPDSDIHNMRALGTEESNDTGAFPVEDHPHRGSLKRKNEEKMQTKMKVVHRSSKKSVTESERASHYEQIMTYSSDGNAVTNTTTPTINSSATKSGSELDEAFGRKKISTGINGTKVYRKRRKVKRLYYIRPLNVLEKISKETKHNFVFCFPGDRLSNALRGNSVRDSMSKSLMASFDTDSTSQAHQQRGSIGCEKGDAGGGGFNAFPDPYVLNPEEKSEIMSVLATNEGTLDTYGFLSRSSMGVIPGASGPSPLSGSMGQGGAALNSPKSRAASASSVGLSHILDLQDPGMMADLMMATFPYRDFNTSLADNAMATADKELEDSTDSSLAISTTSLPFTGVLTPNTSIVKLNEFSQQMSEDLTHDSDCVRSSLHTDQDDLEGPLEVGLGSAVNCTSFVSDIFPVAHKPHHPSLHLTNINSFCEKPSIQNSPESQSAGLKGSPLFSFSHNSLDDSGVLEHEKNHLLKGQMISPSASRTLRCGRAANPVVCVERRDHSRAPSSVSANTAMSVNTHNWYSTSVTRGESRCHSKVKSIPGKKGVCLSNLVTTPVMTQQNSASSYFSISHKEGKKKSTNNTNNRSCSYNRIENTTTAITTHNGCDLHQQQLPQSHPQNSRKEELREPWECNPLSLHRRTESSHSEISAGGDGNTSSVGSLSSGLPLTAVGKEVKVNLGPESSTLKRSKFQVTSTTKPHHFSYHKEGVLSGVGGEGKLISASPHHGSIGGRWRDSGHCSTQQGLLGIPLNPPSSEDDLSIMQKRSELMEDNTGKRGGIGMAKSEKKSEGNASVLSEGLKTSGTRRMMKDEYFPFSDTNLPSSGVPPHELSPSMVSSAARKRRGLTQQEVLAMQAQQNSKRELWHYLVVFPSRITSMGFSCYDQFFPEDGLSINGDPKGGLYGVELQKHIQMLNQQSMQNYNSVCSMYSAMFSTGKTQSVVANATNDVENNINSNQVNNNKNNGDISILPSDLSPSMSPARTRMAREFHFLFTDKNTKTFRGVNSHPYNPSSTTVSSLDGNGGGLDQNKVVPILTSLLSPVYCTSAPGKALLAPIWSVPHSSVRPFSYSQSGVINKSTVPFAGEWYSHFEREKVDNNSIHNYCTQVPTITKTPSLDLVYSNSALPPFGKLKGIDSDHHDQHQHAQVKAISSLSSGVMSFSHNMPNFTTPFVKDNIEDISDDCTSTRSRMGEPGGITGDNIVHSAHSVPFPLSLSEIRKVWEVSADDHKSPQVSVEDNHHGREEEDDFAVSYFSPLQELTLKSLLIEPKLVLGGENKTESGYTTATNGTRALKPDSERSAQSEEIPNRSVPPSSTSSQAKIAPFQRGSNIVPSGVAHVEYHLPNKESGNWNTSMASNSISTANVSTDVAGLTSSTFASTKNRSGRSGQLNHISEGENLQDKGAMASLSALYTFTSVPEDRSSSMAFGGSVCGGFGPAPTIVAAQPLGTPALSLVTQLCGDHLQRLQVFRSERKNAAGTGLTGMTKHHHGSSSIADLSELSKLVGGIHLVGFSKGCVVINELLSELGDPNVDDTPMAMHGTVHPYLGTKGVNKSKSHVLHSPKAPSRTFSVCGTPTRHAISSPISLSNVQSILGDLPSLENGSISIKTQQSSLYTDAPYVRIKSDSPQLISFPLPAIAATPTAVGGPETTVLRLPQAMLPLTPAAIFGSNGNAPPPSKTPSVTTPCRDNGAESTPSHPGKKGKTGMGTVLPVELGIHYIDGGLNTSGAFIADADVSSDMKMGGLDVDSQFVDSQAIPHNIISKFITRYLYNRNKEANTATAMQKVSMAGSSSTVRSTTMRDGATSAVSMVATSATTTDEAMPSFSIQESAKDDACDGGYTVSKGAAMANDVCGIDKTPSELIVPTQIIGAEGNQVEVSTNGDTITKNIGTDLFAPSRVNKVIVTIYTTPRQRYLYNQFHRDQFERINFYRNYDKISQLVGNQHSSLEPPVGIGHSLTTARATPEVGTFNASMPTEGQDAFSSYVNLVPFASKEEWYVGQESERFDPLSLHDIAPLSGGLTTSMNNCGLDDNNINNNNNNMSRKSILAESPFNMMNNRWAALPDFPLAQESHLEDSFLGEDRGEGVTKIKGRGSSSGQGISARQNEYFNFFPTGELRVYMDKERRNLCDSFRNYGMKKSGLMMNADGSGDGTYNLQSATSLLTSTLMRESVAPLSGQGTPLDECLAIKGGGDNRIFPRGIFSTCMTGSSGIPTSELFRISSSNKARIPTYQQLRSSLRDEPNCTRFDKDAFTPLGSEKRANSLTVPLFGSGGLPELPKRSSLMTVHLSNAEQNHLLTDVLGTPDSSAKIAPAEEQSPGVVFDDSLMRTPFSFKAKKSKHGSVDEEHIGEGGGNEKVKHRHSITQTDPTSVDENIVGVVASSCEENNEGFYSKPSQGIFCSQFLSMSSNSNKKNNQTNSDRPKLSKSNLMEQESKFMSSHPPEVSGAATGIHPYNNFVGGDNTLLNLSIVDSAFKSVKEGLERVEKNIQDVDVTTDSKQYYKLNVSHNSNTFKSAITNQSKRERTKKRKKHRKGRIENNNNSNINNPPGGTSDKLSPTTNKEELAWGCDDGDIFTTSECISEIDLLAEEKNKLPIISSTSSGDSIQGDADESDQLLEGEGGSENGEEEAESDSSDDVLTWATTKISAKIPKCKGWNPTEIVVKVLEDDPRLGKIVSVPDALHATLQGMNRLHNNHPTKKGHYGINNSRPFIGVNSGETQRPSTSLGKVVTVKGKDKPITTLLDEVDIVNHCDLLRKPSAEEALKMHMMAIPRFSKKLNIEFRNELKRKKNSS